MNAMRLLPVGIALLSTLPLAAQTTESTPPPPVPEEAVKTLPPLPPMPPLNGEMIYDATITIDTAEFQLDARDFELDARDFEIDARDFEMDAKDFELDARDFDLDTEAFKLDMENFKNMPEGISLQIDSIQQQVRGELMKARESMRAQREVHQEMRRIEREIREKNRELRQMRSQMNGDTAAIQESLRQAEEALNAARQSLSEIAPDMPMAPNFAIPDIAIPNVSVVVNKEVDGKHQQRIVVIGNGAAICNGGNVSVACKAGRNGITSTVIVEDGDSTSATANHWKREKRLVMITTNDSTKAPETALNVRSSSQIVIRNVTEATGEESDKTVYIRSFGSEGMQFSEFPIPPVPPQMAPFKLGDNLIMIGSDSLKIHDGSSEQMLIRVYRDSSNAPNIHTSVVVITMARGQKVDTLSGGGTSDVPMPVELASVSGNAGYTLEANRPNPFSESTTINFVVPKEEHVNLTVFDATGKPVKVLKDEVIPAGAHSVGFDARDLPSGIYLYRLVGGSFSETKTMTITK